MSPLSPLARRVIPAWIAGSALAAGILLASSGGDVERMAYGDGLLYRSVASRIAVDADDVNAVVASRGTSLRYGRIGLSGIMWMLAGGKPRAMRYTHPLTIVLSAGAASAAAAALLPGAGPLAAFIPFLAPGFSLSVAGGYAEAVAIAFALWGFFFALRRRWLIAAGLLAIGILSKETAGIVLLGAIAVALVRRAPRGALLLSGALVPVLAWYSYVWARYGHFPPLDPYLRVTTETIDFGVPGIGIVRSFLHPDSAESAVMAAIHVAIAVLAFVLMRRSAFGAVAAIGALQLSMAGPFAWHYIGDASRLFSVMQLFTILALIAVARRSWVTPEALQPEGPQPEAPRAELAQP